MADRNLFLVTYDVCDARRLRRVHKVMKGYGEALQYSVFRCRLDAVRKIEMISRLHRELELIEDRVMIVDLGPAEGRAPERVEWLGAAPQDEPPGDVVEVDGSVIL